MTNKKMDFTKLLALATIMRFGASYADTISMFITGRPEETKRLLRSMERSRLVVQKDHLFLLTQKGIDHLDEARDACRVFLSIMNRVRK